MPFDGPRDIHVSPLLACIAVRFAGYWAEGLVTVASAPGEALSRAEAALTAMLRKVQAGVTSSDLIRAAAQHLPPYRFHPLVQSAIGNGIGLSFEESPSLGRDQESRLEQGGVYTLRSGALGEGAKNAVVSAMIAVGGTGFEVLWTATDYSRNRGDARRSR